MAAYMVLELQCDRDGCDSHQVFSLECETWGWVQYSEMGCEHDTGVLHEELPEDEQPDEEKAMLVFCSRDCLMFYLASFPPITRVEE